MSGYKMVTITLAILFTAVEALAMGNIILSPSPTTEVSLSKASPSLCPSAARLHSQLGFAALADSSVLISNRSARGIVILKLVWTMADRAGPPRRQSVMSDSYSLSTFDRTRAERRTMARMLDTSWRLGDERAKRATC